MKRLVDQLLSESESFGIISNKQLNKDMIKKIGRYLQKKYSYIVFETGNEAWGDYLLKSLADCKSEIRFDVDNCYCETIETRDRHSGFKDWYNIFQIKKAEVNNDSTKQLIEYNRYRGWVLKKTGKTIE